MRDPVQTVCSLTGCTEEEANRVLNETEDVVEAVDRLLEKGQSKAEEIIKQKRRKLAHTPEEEVIRPIRNMLKEIDEKHSTSLYQPAREAPSETQVPREETVLQNSYFQECQLPSLQSEVEKQETVYQ